MPPLPLDVEAADESGLSSPPCESSLRPLLARVVAIAPFPLRRIAIVTLKRTSDGDARVVMRPPPPTKQKGSRDNDDDEHEDAPNSATTKKSTFAISMPAASVERRQPT